MEKANEIRRHIGVVEETRKITNAMHLVATSRLRRVMSHIEYNRKYFVRIQLAMKDILSKSENLSHRYLTDSGDRTTFIVIAGDKGLAGSYNSNVLNLAMEKITECKNELSLIAVGLVAGEFFRQHGFDPDIEMMGTIQDPSLGNARKIAFDAMDLYDKGLTDEVHIIYTSFFGKTKNIPVVRRLLPLMKSDYDNIKGSPYAGTMIYEPSPEELFSHLVPQYLIGIVFEALVQSYASEHFARMNAMRSATRNADDMLRKLKTQYNMARQAAITQEIAEITGLGEAHMNGDGKHAGSF